MTGGIQMSDIIREPDNHIIPAAQPVRAALPLFEAGSTSTLIVIGESGPLGALRLQDVEDLDDDDLNQPARDLAIEVPVFDRSMDFTVAHEQARFIPEGVEWLPAVNQNGRLVGVVARSDLVIAADAETGDRGTATLEPDGGEVVDVTIETGMDVYGSDGGKVGEVENVVLESGRATYLIIKHGLIRHSRKRLPVSDIEAVGDGRVRLAISERIFDQLPDLERGES